MCSLQKKPHLSGQVDGSGSAIDVDASTAGFVHIPERPIRGTIATRVIAGSRKSRVNKAWRDERVIGRIKCGLPVGGAEPINVFETLLAHAGVGEMAAHREGRDEDVHGQMQLVITVS